MLRFVLAALFLGSFLIHPSTEAQLLASGTFDLEESSGPGDPAFNSALTANHTLPGDLGSTAGEMVVVALRDSSRPDKMCDLDDTFGDLFSGCAAVDWPFPGRRGINLLEVETTTGLETLHLRIGDSLSADPEPDGP